MTVIDQGFTILTPYTTLQGITKRIEVAARTCYQSEGKIAEGTDLILCEKLIKRGHTAMLEHENISVRFITDRGVTHELVRHRHTAYAQESTRYCRYDGDMEFIRPVFDWGKNMEQKLCDMDFSSIAEEVIVCNWYNAMDEAAIRYKTMIEYGASPQEARSVLPNSLKTEIVTTASVREWRSIFELRCAKAAHPQIRELMLPLLQELHNTVPILFDDLYNQFFG